MASFNKGFGLFLVLVGFLAFVVNASLVPLEQVEGEHADGDAQDASDNEAKCTNPWMCVIPIIGMLKCCPNYTCIPAFGTCWPNYSDMENVVLA